LLDWGAMSLGLAIAVLLAALLVAGVANWRERRPRDLGKPSLVPYSAIQVLAVVVIILMLAHLVSLLTGTPLHGRLQR
jgi:ABC-type nickel/cobalt efflux system permease component RcnA